MSANKNRILKLQHQQFQTQKWSWRSIQADERKKKTKVSIDWNFRIELINIRIVPKLDRLSYDRKKINFIEAKSGVEKCKRHKIYWNNPSKNWLLWSDDFSSILPNLKWQYRAVLFSNRWNNQFTESIWSFCFVSRMNSIHFNATNNCSVQISASVPTSVMLISINACKLNVVANVKQADARENNESDLSERLLVNYPAKAADKSTNLWKRSDFE